MDIIERLRAGEPTAYENVVRTDPLKEEAADVIARLRAKLRSIYDLAGDLHMSDGDVISQVRSLSCQEED